MLANWKPLALVAIGVVTMLWLGPHNDSSESYSNSELAMNAPSAAGCVARRGARDTYF
jgi:hypothetical protein